jgi:hypothetical protein
MFEVKFYRNGMVAGYYNQVISALVKRDSSAADSLELVIAAARPKDVFSVVELISNGEIIFEGIIDQQKYTLTCDGEQLTVYARSYCALLIDNEACPCTLRNPSVRMIEDRYLRPYGFCISPADRERSGGFVPIGELVVGKSTSIYRLIINYCKKFLNTVPIVRGNTVCLGFDSAKMGDVFNAGGLLSFSCTDMPCELCSQIYIRNSVNGSYTVSKYGDGTLGYRRVKYRDTAQEDEFKMQSSYDVKFAGIVNCLPEDIIKLSDYIGGEKERFTVKSVRIYVDSDGTVTQVRGTNVAD